MKYRLSRNNEVIYEVSAKADEPYKVLAGLMTLDAVKQGLFGRTDLTITSSGVKHITYNKGVYSSGPQEHDGEIATSANSCTICGSGVIGDSTTFVEYEDETGHHIADFKILFEAWEEGFVLKSGKQIAGLYDVCDGYVSKITSRRINTNKRRYAKVYSLKQLMKLLQDRQYALKWCVENLGFHFSAEVACDRYQNDAGLEKINQILELINGVSQRKEAEELEGIATDKEMHDEAIHRMQSLKLLNQVINDFKKGKRLWKSQYHGVLYWLDEDDDKVSAEALKELPSDVLPYHIIKNEGDITNVAVLTVTRNKADWKYERPDVDGILSCFVYNPDFGYDYGSIKVLEAYGGLARIA